MVNLRRRAPKYSVSGERVAGGKGVPSTSWWICLYSLMRGRPFGVEWPRVRRSTIWPSPRGEFGLWCGRMEIIESMGLGGEGLGQAAVDAKQATVNLLQTFAARAASASVIL